MATHAHTRLVKACLDLLKIRGIPAWKNNTGSVRMPSGSWVAFSAPGLPDVLAILPPTGRLAGFECKTGRGRLTPVQRAARDRLIAAGAFFAIVSDIAELNRILNLLLEDSDHGQEAS